jgi:hypothetical protein
MRRRLRGLLVVGAAGRRDDDLTPGWGMHLVGVNVAQGNLIDIAEAQAATWAAAH